MTDAGRDALLERVESRTKFTAWYVLLTWILLGMHCCATSARGDTLIPFLQGDPSNVNVWVGRVKATPVATLLRTQATPLYTPNPTASPNPTAPVVYGISLPGNPGDPAQIDACNGAACVPSNIKLLPTFTVTPVPTASTTSTATVVPTQTPIAKPTPPVIL